MAAAIAALPKTYDHYYWVYGPDPRGANCGTWGDEGRPNRIAVYSSYSFGSLVGYAQEIGHNFGMTHEPTITCAGAAPFLDDPTQCTHVEYGNHAQLHGRRRAPPVGLPQVRAGLDRRLQRGEGRRLRDLHPGPAGACPATASSCCRCRAQDPRPRRRPVIARATRRCSATTTLEMRAPYGFDSNLAPMVLMSIGGALPTVAAAAPYLYMLDLKPEAGRANHNNAGLMTVGQTYSDPAGGLTFTLMAIDDRSATVNVTSTGPAPPPAWTTRRSPFRDPTPPAAGPAGGRRRRRRASARRRRR